VKTRRALRFAAGLVLAAPWVAWSCDGLEFDSPWIREPPPGAAAAAAYGTLRNAGDSPIEVDRVAAAGFGMAMLHETVQMGDRVGMRHRERLTVPAHGELKLSPGGLHVMLMHPAKPLAAGDEAELTLGCGDAERSWRVPVRDAAP
jgi:copper(I)-binding protein